MLKKTYKELEKTLQTTMEEVSTTIKETVNEQLDDTANNLKEKVGEVLAESPIKEILEAHDEIEEPYYLTVSSTDPSQKPLYGDILCVRRLDNTIQHYGVYIDNEHVIHYTPSTGELGLDTRIRQTSLAQFLCGQDSYYICLFPDEYKNDADEAITASGLGATFFKERHDFIQDMIESLLPFLNWDDTPEYHLFTPEETVERAKKRLGEADYHLFTNNCEHFALWCKTNISESHQIQKLIKGLCHFPMQILPSK